MNEKIKKRIQDASSTGLSVGQCDSKQTLELIKYISLLSGVKMPEKQALDILSSHLSRTYSSLRSEEVRLAFSMNIEGELDNREGAVKIFGTLSASHVAEVLKRYRFLKSDLIKKQSYTPQATSTITPFDNLGSIMLCYHRSKEFPEIHDYARVFAFLTEQGMVVSQEDWAIYEDQERKQRIKENRGITINSGMVTDGFVDCVKKRSVWGYIVREYFDSKTPNELLKQALDIQLGKNY